jgi:hypothetical protein
MAKKVADALRDMTDGYEIDWVGTGEFGRPDDENRAALARFVTRKDARGRRPQPELDILVQVGMCAEGADTVNVVEIVDLSLSTYTEPAVTDRQFIGRGARAIAVGGERLEIPCTVWVPSDNPIADCVGTERFCSWLDSIECPPDAAELDCPESEEEADDWPGDIKIDANLIRVRDVSLEEIMEGDHFSRFVEVSGQSGYRYDLDNPADLEAARDVFKRVYKIERGPQIKQEELAENLRLLTEQTKRFAYSLLRVMHGDRQPPKAFGAVSAAVSRELAQRSGYYKGDITNLDQVRKHLDFLKEMAAECNLRRAAPNWLITRLAEVAERRGAA